MTVEELINELMASCQSLEDQVCVGSAGLVTLVSGETVHRDETYTVNQVWLNNYPPEGDSKE